AYATDDVRIVPVAAAAGKPAIVPTIATVQDKTYPIARPLFMYTNGEPEGDIGVYLAWIKSDAGQQVLRDKGYVPLR
ncbi:MAG: phosphate-binding protein, partial [Planctomycetes bacterium]|nr:phosphate-binding protein [Planctomycetota bacterium]